MWYLSPDLLANLDVFAETDGKYYCRSYESGKLRQALPEELIRQLLVIKLVLHYNIPRETILTEYPIQIGRTKKRADVVTLGLQAKPYIIAEIKTMADADTIFQLQSYVNVTHASYAIIATQVELLTFQPQNGQLHKIADIPVLGAHSETRESVVPALDFLGLEKLKRLNEGNSVLFIQGKNFPVKNSDLSTYKKIKNLAIAKGIVLPPNISEVHWTRILEKLFADASTSDAALTGAAPAEKWHSSGLGSFLIDARAKQVGPFAQKIITSRAVLDFVMHSGPA
ncbi:MAG TPA: type I restriction enzyme HsdR N-terminal domain-containing protein, partial [Turneriella sp.]|nr:type I restriction enzyme HsdR N-terminal domain-containing protein [Turneriella sp.]